MDTVVMSLLFLLLFLGHVDETFFECNGEGDERVAGVVLVDPGLDLGQPLVLLADVVALGEVDEVRDGLGGEELEAVHNVDLRGDKGERVLRWHGMRKRGVR